MTCKYFFPFCRLPFSFASGFLYSAEAFYIEKFHLLIFAFLDFLLVSNLQNPSPGSRWRRLPPMFSFKTSTFSGLPLKSNTWVVLMSGVREGFSFILLYVAVEFSQHYWKDYPLSTLYLWLHSYELIDHMCTGLLLDSPSCSTTTL